MSNSASSSGLKVYLFMGLTSLLRPCGPLDRSKLLWSFSRAGLENRNFYAVLGGIFSTAVERCPGRKRGTLF
jgi:hypothetical protein